MLKRVLRFLGLLGATIILVSCSSKPTNFYLLNEIQGHGLQKTHHLNKAVIGIGPVTFPKYLNQPQIVTRTSLNKINIDEFNQWAEPLRDNFTQVLSKNIQGILPNNDVSTYPWPLTESIHYQVVVDVYRFDASVDGKIICQLDYQIIKPNGYVRLVSKTKTYEDFIQPKFSYAQLAMGMSRIVGRIARDIALEITQIAR